MSGYDYQKEPQMNYGPKRIANMIAANVLAMEAGRITWAQFGRVQRATWDLADRDELCIIGSPCARRVHNVQKALNARSQA
jgi:hypothetical protein